MIDWALPSAEDALIRVLSSKFIPGGNERAEVVTPFPKGMVAQSFFLTGYFLVPDLDKHSKETHLSR